MRVLIISLLRKKTHDKLQMKFKVTYLVENFIFIFLMDFDFELYVILNTIYFSSFILYSY